MVKENKKLPPDEETKKWAGSKENYYLRGSGDETELTVELDIADDHEQFFKDTFPKALDKVKELAE